MNQISRDTFMYSLAVNILKEWKAKSLAIALLNARFAIKFLTVVILFCAQFCSFADEVKADEGTSLDARRDADSTWCKAALKIPGRAENRARQERGNDNPMLSSSNVSDELVEPVLALALSGGGYRAMLFHIGTLRRLNDSGLLPHISIVSSVSGGSVTAAYLAYRWTDLKFDDSDRAANFVEVVEAPLRQLAQKTLDIPSVIFGLFPFHSSAMEQVKEFDRQLLKGALLSSIAPGGDDGDTKRPRPLFILNATNLQTGELWQLRSSAIGGPITHWTSPGKILLSEAVAASSGFPPFLSPMVLELPEGDVPANWRDCSDFRDNPYGIFYRNEPGRVLPDDSKTLASYRRKVHLTDGGVRDNLGIGTIEEINRLRRLDGIHQSTVTLISDGGAITALDANPPSNWAGQGLRILHLMSDQPDEVRIAHIIRTNSARLRHYGWRGTESSQDCPSPDIPPALEEARRRAAMDLQFDAYAYWSIRRSPKLHRGFECPEVPQWMLDEVRALSSLPTAFRAMPAPLQARLINWGYLAAHHGIPYVDAAWPDPNIRQRWLGSCLLPYGAEISDPERKTPSARNARCFGLAADPRR